MKRVIKNARWKYIIVIPIFTIIMLVLMKAEGVKSTSVLRTALGGVFMGRPFIMIGFMFFIGYIQYVNLDLLTYALSNDSYLIVRYEKRTPLFNILVKEIGLSNILFVIAIGISSFLATYIQDKILLEISVYEVAEILFRTFVLAVGITLIQFILLIKTSQARSFLVMIGITMLLIFMSRYSIGVLTILPSHLVNVELWINMIFCLVLLMMEILITKKIYLRKEAV